MFVCASLSHMFHSIYSIHMFLFYTVRRRRACQYSVQLNSPCRNYIIYQIIWNKNFFLRNQSKLSLTFKPLSDCLLLSCCAAVCLHIVHFQSEQYRLTEYCKGGTMVWYVCSSPFGSFYTSKVYKGVSLEPINWYDSGPLSMLTRPNISCLKVIIFHCHLWQS